MEYKERFSNKTAIAPTASISIICGGASPGIEPIAANSYTHKTLSGSFNVRNKYLRRNFTKNIKRYMMKLGLQLQQTKVQYLIRFFNRFRKRCTFKTAFEINQRWIVELSADRTPSYFTSSIS